jgi:invasion protein IalB
MRNLVLVSLSALVLTPLASAPAVAQADQQQQSAKKALDPNQVVCEKQEETGSRLASKRVCMTRSQWAEQRRLDRQEVDRAQTQKSMNAPQ